MNDANLHRLFGTVHNNHFYYTSNTPSLKQVNYVQKYVFAQVDFKLACGLNAWHKLMVSYPLIENS